MKLRRLSTRDKGFDRKLDALTRYDAAQDPKVQSIVRRILADVRKRGDAAVREYTRKFDGVAPRIFRSRTRPSRAGGSAAAAHERIGLSTRSSQDRGSSPKPTARASASVTRSAVGLSARRQGGLSVLGADERVPAKVAGVRDRHGEPEPDPLVLAAALAGVDRVIGIGGAQAIGALAYGTKSIPRVDKIVGPATPVAEAKRQVLAVGIDMVAGPSEILSSPTARPGRLVAMDLFSQAEHDESRRRSCSPRRAISMPLRLRSKSFFLAWKERPSFPPR
jgi:histidinol dehydrogenase